MTQEEYLVNFFLQSDQGRPPRELSDEVGMGKAGSPEAIGLGLVIGTDLPPKA